MCKNATATAASVMKAVEPTLTALLTYTNLNNTANGAAAIKAYNAALIAVENWKTGSKADTVLQLIADFQTVFNGLPLPPADTALANIILAGVETTIGILAANSPAPASPTPVATAASEEEATALYQIHVAKDTEARVHALVPEFKRSLWHSPAHQYRQIWNHTVDEKGFPPSLKV